ncbi:hypothetical protein [Cedecea sp.]|jgi:HlyD family secretion protein|uniref:hypothetical protein n=1 Tax=Cedecea sp. TaxID=1970739 RepID=UPI002F4144A3
MFSRYNHLLLFPLLSALISCDNTPGVLFSGYAQGEFIYLSHEATEKIDAILVKKDQSVRKGQALVRMESFNTENAVRIEEKNYRAEAASLKDLTSGERREELDVIRSQLTRARIAAELAKRQLPSIWIHATSPQPC